MTAAELVVGNVEVLFSVVLGLAAMATIGTVAADFAMAVQARRQTLGIYRATGATRRQVLALVLGDAVQVCAVAIPAALLIGAGGMWVLQAAGWLTVFGITVWIAGVSPLALLSTALAALAIALCGAIVATWPLLRAPPARVLFGAQRTADGSSTPSSESGQDSGVRTEGRSTVGEPGDSTGGRRRVAPRG